MLTGSLKTSRPLRLFPVCLLSAASLQSDSLSPACLSSSPLTLCLSVLLQEEKGISCELVDLDFLRCSVGFPFMRAQTKVALTWDKTVTLTHRLSSSCRAWWGLLLPVLKTHCIMGKTLNYTLLFAFFSHLVSFCSDFWHDTAVRGRRHVAVLSSSKKVTSNKIHSNIPDFYAQQSGNIFLTWTQSILSWVKTKFLSLFLF